MFMSSSRIAHECVSISVYIDTNCSRIVFARFMHIQHWHEFAQFGQCCADLGSWARQLLVILDWLWKRQDRDTIIAGREDAYTLQLL